MRNPSTASSSSETRKTPCCSKVGLKRGPWTPEEDELLANYIKREGEGQWRMLPKHANLLRCGKSCRLRWMNYLRPSVKRGQIAPDEEDLILRLHRLLGNRWALIAGRIPGRTDNEIKNYWNTHLSKKLIRQGIDPRTHKPLNPNPNSSRIVPKTAPYPNPNPNPNFSRIVHPIKPNPNRCPYPNPDPNPNFSGIEQSGRDWYCKSSEETKVTNLDQYKKEPVADYSIENWQNCDGLLRGLQKSQGSYGNEGDDIGNCNEDTFSSFLNSLFNEDDFTNQQHQHPNILAPSSSNQPVLSSIQFFNHSTDLWEAALTSTMASLVDEQKDVNNHMA